MLRERSCGLNADKVVADQGSLMRMWSKYPNTCANVAQIAKEVRAGSVKKVSGYTVDYDFLSHVGLQRHRPIRVLMLTPVYS